MSSLTLDQLVEHTMNHTLNPQQQLANAVIGLAGEAGEVADVVKKHLFQGHGLDKAKLTKEIGDVLWYLELLYRETGLTQAVCEEAAITKLLARFPDGFSTNDSINRPAE
jgi:NTP pyrophosphatase (non-canonical NTP hydrolase)